MPGRAMTDEEYAEFLPKWARNRGVLGKAVHPAALVRLHELYPNARVSVRHFADAIELPKGSMRFGNRYYREPEHETIVYIDVTGEGRPGTGDKVYGSATCHPLDNYDRRKGIALAFTRALDMARRKHDPEAWVAAKAANKKKTRGVRR